MASANAAAIIKQPRQVKGCLGLSAAEDIEASAKCGFPLHFRFWKNSCLESLLPTVAGWVMFPYAEYTFLNNNSHIFLKVKDFNQVTI